MSTKGAMSSNTEQARLLEERQKKILEYERFIDERLKVDLQQTLEIRDKIYDKLSQLVELRTKIQTVKEEKLSEMKTMINLGSEIYVQANVKDTSKIYVNVGLGFHVEYTLDEALDFISTREVLYNKRAEEVTQKAAKIKTQIKLLN
ncbi:prefoldin alpha subunit family protein [Planoprotostelium fungivorum]|uniref:Prefoldin alpha subunit family protein n=1 Tax=Planoprotostelium fungivorum TaxID=1890364 RepID=A0A2P6NX70_9EUKA|nr:prefoldin alpha subunit family protein [Planoprotostelium fungivorum]